MDVLSGFFDGPRASGAFALRARMEPPWSVEVRDEAPLSVVVIVSGQAWVESDDGATALLRPGDVALLRGPDAYTFADAPGRAVTAVILPGQVCQAPDGRSLSAEMDLGVRTWGNDPHGSTTMLIGSYHGSGEVGRRLTDALPPLAVLPAGTIDDAATSLLECEVGRDLPGQSVVLDRLLDLLVVQCVRAWAAAADRPPVWAAGNDDPVVGAALALLHERPAEPWRLEALAREVHVSRASLARRFHDAVGQPPMAYLTGWRLALAADLLAGGSATVTQVAAQVGYGSPFTFSTAFKKAYGHSPRDHRAHLAS